MGTAEVFCGKYICTYVVHGYDVAGRSHCAFISVAVYSSEELVSLSAFNCLEHHLIDPSPSLTIIVIIK